MNISATFPALYNLPPMVSPKNTGPKAHMLTES